MITLQGFRTFGTESTIKKSILRSKNYNEDKESPEEASAFLFFSTRKQRTWLVATPHRLYCILDDVRKTEPHINWSMSKRKLFDAEGLSLEISSKNRSYLTGTVDFGSKHKGWYFSRNLFSENEPIEKAAKAFILAAMPVDE